MNVNEFVMTYEVTIHLSFFFAVFVAIAVWDIFVPRRVLNVFRTVRWANNPGLVFLMPGIQRAHHSVEDGEAKSNLCFSLSWLLFKCNVTSYAGNHRERKK